MAARDNPYYIEPANAMSALMSGMQGYDRSQKAAKQAELEAGRQRAGEVLSSGGDIRNVLGQLYGIGDIEGIKPIADFAHHRATEQQAKTQQQQQDQQFKLTHGLHQLQFGLAKSQADAAARGIDYKEVESPDGGKMLVRIDKANDRVTKPPIAGVPDEPANPYAPTQKLTNDETNARAYVGRMLDAHKTITGLESINDSATGWAGGVAAGRPVVRDSAAFNTMASADRQRSIQAQRNFVNAILRKESGAAIGKDEFENAQRQYFPQPGDGPDVIAQKRTNRMVAMEGMMQGAGRGYKPPSDYVGTKGAAGAKTTLKNGDVVDWSTYFGGAK